MKRVQKRRKRIEIFYDILKVSTEARSKNYIMRRANLSYKLLTRYLRDLLNLKLLSESPEYYRNRGTDWQVYKATEEGLQFINDYNIWKNTEKKLTKYLLKK